MKEFKSIMLNILIGGEAELFSNSGSCIRVIFTPQNYAKAFEYLSIGSLVDFSLGGCDTKMFSIGKAPVRWSNGEILLELNAAPDLQSPN